MFCFISNDMMATCNHLFFPSAHLSLQFKKTSDIIQCETSQQSPKENCLNWRLASPAESDIWPSTSILGLLMCHELRMPLLLLLGLPLRSPNPKSQWSSSPNPKSQWSSSPNPKSQWSSSPNPKSQWSSSPNPKSQWSSMTLVFGIGNLRNGGQNKFQGTVQWQGEINPIFVNDFTFHGLKYMPTIKHQPVEKYVENTKFP